MKIINEECTLNLQGISEKGHRLNADINPSGQRGSGRTAVRRKHTICKTAAAKQSIKVTVAVGLIRLQFSSRPLTQNFCEPPHQMQFIYVHNHLSYVFTFTLITYRKILIILTIIGNDTQIGK